MRISGLLILGVIALWLYNPNANDNLVRLTLGGVAITLLALGSLPRREKR